MSTTGSDRPGLDDVRCLYRRMTEIDMPASMKNELDHLSEQLVGAAECTNEILDWIASGISLLLDIYDYVKTLPAADDG